MTLLRKETETRVEHPSAEAAPETENELKAPAVAAKLDVVVAELAVLEAERAALVLAASEGKPGAAAKLSAHRAKIDVAACAVDDLDAALRLAQQLDRQAAAGAVIDMRAGQMTAFAAAMQDRGKAMAEVMTAVASLAAAFGKFSAATLRAQIATPAGTVVPEVGMGPNGALGPSFSPCERLLLAELWRLGPDRDDGAGRFVLPLVKSSPLLTNADHRTFAPGIDEFRKADQVVLDEIEKQIERMNSAVLRAAERKDAA
ncbi:hypothetical protein H8A95_21930 [Bradyrhizobium sp. Pear76]|uniref:hypothetical protein n=1 Tax=Bradyrhizobium oropedii TaxID=1571201 RepID=UPI001E2D6D70|nr:hypothetical protein [Bradyrhizobium oropedii]MCC8964898.1 hypothetical protein [Bradyrhizobium oropedii]